METYADDQMTRGDQASMHVLERLTTEFLADIRERAGLHVYDQRDPGGRVVSYGYHWHEPDAQGGCENWIVYGYATPLDALSAGFCAKLNGDQVSDIGGGFAGRLMARCTDAG